MQDDDDDLTLSTAAQTALAEFLAEKQGKEAEELDGQVEGSVSIDAFPEDWQVCPVYRLPPESLSPKL